MIFNRPTTIPLRKGRSHGPIAFLLFAICASVPCDAAAPPSTAGNDGEARTKAEAVAADELFTSIPFVRLRIVLPEAEVNKLRNYYWNRSGFVMDKPEARGDVHEGDRVYTNVAVQLKGSAGSFRPVDDRPALTLKFDKYAKGQSFHGLDKFSLNNSIQDPSYLAEKISREIFTAAGVPVPRAGHAVVEFNGRPLGVYVLTEGWDKKFLRRHFSNVKGNLYDSGFKQDITEPLEVNSGDHPEDRSALQRLVQAASERDLAKRWERLQPVLDVDRFIKMVALEVMTAHWDGYTMNVNNYRVFHDLDTAKLVFMPHGLDQMFGWRRMRSDQDPILPATASLLTSAVLQTPEGRRQHLQTLRQLMTNVYHSAALTNRVRTLANQLRPAFFETDLSSARSNQTSVSATHSAAATTNAMAKNAMAPAPVAPRTAYPSRTRFTRSYDVTSFDSEVNDLCERIAIRGQAIQEQLAALNNTLRFDESGAAPLGGWKARKDFGNPVLEETKDAEGKTLLYVKAASGSSAGTWRTEVWLEGGSYRLEGRVKVQGVVPDPGDARGGAGLHHSSRPMTQKLNGNADWTVVTHDLPVYESIAKVTLICELRAGKGEAWFDTASLRLIRKE